MRPSRLCSLHVEAIPFSVNLFGGEHDGVKGSVLLAILKVEPEEQNEFNLE
jgi:hypothetical protein